MSLQRSLPRFFLVRDFSSCTSGIGGRFRSFLTKRAVWANGLPCFTFCPLKLFKLTSTGNIPLNDLGRGSYKGFTAGLYPAGSDMPPAAHAAAALAIATDQIKPLNASGNPDSVNGRIVMISIGMSNTTQEFASKGTQTFKLRADADPAKNPQLVIVDGAQSGRPLRLGSIRTRRRGTWSISDSSRQASRRRRCKSPGSRKRWYVQATTARSLRTRRRCRPIWKSSCAISRPIP